ncbi:MULTISPECIES: hypothetical protein [unclassified Fibrobacter]|jgi:hypothetical protein|uniref:hypothetical protein n=1 Tax=unclassified Fibrobacter TaxID=2634177 RepID=UPI0009180B35|nr:MULTISPECIES: hypothetical protein [unclassified Fibrobacter]MBQ9225309.1 hypothetical protein [Fibrobacter sp.]MBR4007799.1 hypothetical protein [Fibrobacter sp.]SHM70659.1 hypothetical protein SAMN05720472_2048 [Fibrobacter sp. UWR3]
MSLELLEQKLRTLPEDSFDEVDEFFDFILFRFEKESSQDDLNEETKAALREVEEMKADPSKGKSYTDVDTMMQELLA